MAVGQQQELLHIVTKPAKVPTPVCKCFKYSALCFCICCSKERALPQLCHQEPGPSLYHHHHHHQNNFLLALKDLVLFLFLFSPPSSSSIFSFVGRLVFFKAKFLLFPSPFIMHSHKKRHPKFLESIYTLYLIKEVVYT